MSNEFDKELDGLLPKPTPEEIEMEKLDKERKAVNRVIKGQNDVFKKKYTYTDLGLEFTIKIKAPNAIEVGKIQARKMAYLNGMSNYTTDYFSIVYDTLAALRVTGIDVPKELASDEDLYNLDIIYQIGVDFQQWLARFQF
ncbi:tail assembly chaperone [Bacillus phage Eldridge]|uniref:Tail assembly chaperone n=1 Tax=Bacillus phage Eldridge TaxID=1776293 RepID=A0A0Y0DBE3_9CAUD|nr:tail assembly chaperone [Bacillus phage Eldridge]AMB18652.1 tail assembly chaperone [Bacillus phage Eldridge]